MFKLREAFDAIEKGSSEKKLHTGLGRYIEAEHLINSGKEGIDEYLKTRRVEGGKTIGTRGGLETEGLDKLSNRGAVDAEVANVASQPIARGAGRRGSYRTGHRGNMRVSPAPPPSCRTQARRTSPRG